MTRFADHLTDVADVLHSTADKGEVRVNFGEETTGEGLRADVQVWGPDGFVSRPNDPSDKGVCQALYLVDGQQQRVIATRDNRFAAQAGTLDPGDRLIVSDSPARFYLKRKRQRIGLYTEAKDPPPVGGKGMTIDLDGEAGNVLIKRGGQVFELAADGGISIVCAGAGSQSSITMTPTSITLSAGVIYIDGGNVTVGVTGGAVRPGIPGVDSALYGAMGQSGVASSCVFIAK